MSEFNFKQYLKEGKLVKEDNNFGNNLRFSLKRGNTYSVLEPGMNEYLDDLEFIGYDMNDREYIFMDSTNIAPSSNDVFFLKVPDSEIEAALGRGDEELEEGKKKSLKENSDDYIVDQNAGYLIDQIADDMMYTEFDSKEDINKFIDSITAGINKLKMEKIEQWEEANTEPDFMDPDFDPNLEEGSRHYYGAKMDDEYDEELYNKSSQQTSSTSDELDIEDEEDEYGKMRRFRDYEEKNQRVLRNMREGKKKSKLDEALESASTKLLEDKKKKKDKKKVMSQKDVLKKLDKKQKLRPDMFSGVVEDAMIDMNFYSISDISSDKSKSKKFIELALKGMKQQDKEAYESLKSRFWKEQLDFFKTSSFNI